ncbi:hypothetical protein [Shewanella sp. MSW]|uniref:hypothetical protein n=1 Tax=Shewanella sp. MSW TaxID=2569536 RepID=UPI0011855A7D|nr:hypothetical protein [Shewanella sp. MSW]TVP10236.1 hypothetical protein AYI96_13115 [Shewanella sp. MSW]
MNGSCKETTFEIRDSKCFISLNDGLWQQIGQKSQKHAELMRILDSANFSAHGFMMNHVPIEIYERLMDEAKTVCELFWNVPQLINVLSENREGRKPKAGVKPFLKNVIERKVNYQLENADYEVYQALFNRTPPNGHMDDWFPVWIAACICVFENKIHDALNQGADLVELEDEQNSVISKIVRPLDELLRFEVRESKKAREQRVQSQRGGGKSQKPKSVMQQEIAEVLADPELVKRIENSYKPRPHEIAIILKEKRKVDEYSVGVSIWFEEEVKAKSWGRFSTVISELWSQRNKA